MNEVKNSALLQELMEKAKAVGTKPHPAFTAERLLYVMIEKIAAGGDLANEEYAEARGMVIDFFPNLQYAREVLYERICSTSPVTSLDPIYMSLKVQAAIRRFESEEDKCLTVPILLSYIFKEPSDTVKKALIGACEEAAKNPRTEEDMEDWELKILQEVDKEDSYDVVSGMSIDELDSIELPETSTKQEMSELVEEVKRIKASLKSRVFGQDNAIDVFVSGYFQARMLAMTDKTRRRPKASFLFAGPPGVGKTFLAESVAKALGMENKFKIFDMSEYCDKEAAIEFIGSDNVYKNSKGGNFTTYLAENPECILLFDEIEKAHISIIHLFLQILDAGRIRDSNTDTELSLKDVIIIFTTNAGKQLYQECADGDLSGISRKVVLNALRKDINPATGAPYFPDAICSRFASGNVVMFNHIRASDLLRIAGKEIERHANNLGAETGITVTLDPAVYSALLYSEGGTVDARTIRSRAETFFNSELYELLRLIATDKVKTTIEDIESIRFEVDLNGLAPEIRSLFEKSEKQRVLVFAGEKAVEACKARLADFEIIGVQSKDAAFEALKRAPIDIALLDMTFGTEDRSLAALNIEDVDSPVRDFLQFLREKRETVPIYLLEEKTSTLTEEEEDSFLGQGVRGVLSLSGKKSTFEKQLREIAGDLYRQACLTRLARENKLVSFETAQTVSRGGKTATVRLFDFKLTVAVDSEDSKNVLSGVSKPNVRFDDVIGANEAKEELRYFVNYLKNPHKYTGTGVKAPRGVLLYGPPGTGKTLLAKAVAAESGMTFIAAEGNQFLCQHVGEGSEKVHELFRTARKYAPTVLFIDEIDAIAKERRGGSNTGGVEETLTAFLTEMDGFSTDTSRPVFVLAATNFDVTPGGDKSLDGALMRRFDRRVYIDLPGKADRIRFLRMKMEKNTALTMSDGEIENIAMRSTGMSLAELDSVVELALRSAIRKDSTTVDDAIFEEAFETFHSGEQKKWEISQLERVARHEAGHALLCTLSGETPSYLTVVARGNHGGYMQHAEQEGKAIYTKEELLAKIRTSLGGRAAEIVCYGEKDGISTGASGDLASATHLARQLVCAYGMDETFGLAVVHDSTAYGAMSEKVLGAVNRILNEQMALAVRLITEHRDKLDKLVSVLLEKNHLNQAEIADLICK